MARLVLWILVVIIVAAAFGFRGEAEAEMPQVEPLYLVIAEVGWAGTAASSADEYVELYNVSGNPIAIGQWYIELEREDGTTSTIVLPEAMVGLNESALFERTDDTVVSTKTAHGTYSGGLPNSGIIAMRLYSWDDVLQDQILMPDGEWPAGDATLKASMSLDYTTGEWFTSGIGKHQDAEGNLILGTPGELNARMPLDCSLIRWYDYSYGLSSTTFEDLSTQFIVEVDMLLGDGTQVGGELWWSTGMLEPRGWHSRISYYTDQWPEGITDGCIDVFETLLDGAENILNRRPSTTPWPMPQELVVFLNEVHHFQASNPFASHLPLVTEGNQ